MPYDLGRVDARLKWAVTCLLLTFGLAYLFGGVMVALYAGFAPKRIAATYAEPAAAVAPETTMVVEHAMPMSEFDVADSTEIHFVDTKLLVQDTHVHVPMYGVIAGLLSLVVLGLGVSRRWGYALITLLFAAPWLDFTGMWLTKFVAPQFALLTAAGGWTMGLGYTVVTLLALRRMWLPGKEGTAI
ncbi:MAG TPA: hypothetical protein VIV10_05170 [Gemmatimonadales bacterium]|nr:hypothetical protein [Gemmatimonadales bacterium]